MTKKELLQDYKIKYIENARTYSDGAKKLTEFFYNYFKDVRKIYKTYHSLFTLFNTYDISVILTPWGSWYYEHNLDYCTITKTLDKKIKSIMTELNYKYLYDI